MTSSLPFKIILTIDSINHRINYGTSYSGSGRLSVMQFAQLIEQECPKINDLDIFDHTKYLIEIFDKDFNDYVRLEEDGTIDNLSRLRVTLLSGKTPLNNSLSSSKGCFNDTYTTAQSNVWPSLEKVTSNKETSNNDLTAYDADHVAVGKSDPSVSDLAVSSTPVASGKSGKVKKKKDKLSKDSSIVELSFKRCHDETNEETAMSEAGSRKKIQTVTSKSLNKLGKNTGISAAGMTKTATKLANCLMKHTTFPEVANLNHGPSLKPVDMDNLCKDFTFNFRIDKSPASYPFLSSNSSKTLAGVKTNKDEKFSTFSPKKLESLSDLTAKSTQSDMESKTPNKLAKAIPTTFGSRDGGNQINEQKKKKGKAVDQINVYLNQLSDGPCCSNRNNLHLDSPSTSATENPPRYSGRNDQSHRSDLDQLLDDEHHSSQELQRASSSRIIIDDYGRKQLTEEDFILPDLEEKKKFIDIFTPYVRRFSALNRYEDAWEADEIWDQISENLSEVNIYIDPKREFANLLGQYIDIITHLCDWTEQECNQLWPLFLKFHYELTLTPFKENIDDLIMEFEGHPKRNPDRNLGGAIQEKVPRRPKHPKRRARSFNSRQKYSDESKPQNGVLARIGRKTLTTDHFIIDDFEEKQLVVETLIEVMGTMDKSQMITEAAIWDNVSQRLDGLILNSNPKQCRKHFITLLKQYQAILKHLIDWTPEDCQELWPFFYPFHYSIDFSILQQPFQKAKRKFNEHVKRNFNFPGRHESQYYETRHRRPTSSSFCSDINEPNHEEIGQKEIQLVYAVFHNIEFMDKLSEDSFWQRIAYEMGSWSSPLQDSSRLMWKRLFYKLLQSYENELTHQTQGEYHQLFSGYDITPFLKNRELRNDNSLEASNANASAKMVPQAVLRRFKPPSETPTVPLSSIPASTSQAVPTSSPSKRKSNVNIAGNYCNNNPDTIADQLVLITIFANRLKQDEINPQFWERLNKDLEKAGKVVNPQTNLEDYFTRMARTQLDMMKISESDIDAVKKWPLFKVLNDLDLSYFFDDKWTYRKLKSKFQ